MATTGMCGITSSSKAASPSRSCRGHTPQSSKTRWTATCGRMCSISVPPLTPHLISHAHMDYLSLSLSLSHTLSAGTLAYHASAAPPESGVDIASFARLRSGFSLSCSLSLPHTHSLTHSLTQSRSLPPGCASRERRQSLRRSPALWSISAFPPLPLSLSTSLTHTHLLTHPLTLAPPLPLSLCFPPLFFSVSGFRSLSLALDAGIPRVGRASQERHRHCLLRSPALWSRSLSLPLCRALSLSHTH